MVNNMFYINIFILYSLLGHLLEMVFQSFFIENPNSGILFGPWTPVYGFGALIIILTYKTIFKKLHLNKFIEIVIAFITVSILLSFIEWLGGILIEKIFGIIFWDYSDQRFNLGRYISLEMTLLWGSASLICYYIVHPILYKLIVKIPKIVTYIFSILFLIDLVYTIVSKIY